MKHIELLKLSVIVIFIPIIIWMVSFRSTVNVWNNYRAAKHELSLCDTMRRVAEVKKPALSLMDFVVSKEVKLLKYNRYLGADSVIINELIMTGNFIEQVKFLDALSEFWDISSLSITSTNTTIIIQELTI